MRFPLLRAMFAVSMATDRYNDSVWNLTASGLQPSPSLKLTSAAERGAIDVIPQLLSERADLNFPWRDERTPLILAIQRVPPDAAVAELIARGANVNLISEAGESPVQLASKGNKIEIIEILLTAGVDINLLTSRGTPLLIAIQERQTEAAMMLINRGASGDIPGPGEATPLMRAVETANRVVFDAILAAQPDINCADHTGKTALYRAIDLKKEYMVQQLTNAGAYDDNSYELAKTYKRFHRLLNEARALVQVAWV